MHLLNQHLSPHPYSLFLVKMQNMPLWLVRTVECGSLVHVHWEGSAMSAY